VNKTSCFWRRQISNGDIVWGRQSNGTCTPTFEFEETDQWIVYTRNSLNCHYIDDENFDQILSNTPFESELTQFDRSIKDSKPNSIVFYGSSSIRFWSTLVNDFSNTQLNVINRGFGGSTLEQCSQQLKRIILPLEPRLLILYAGENDLFENQTAITVQSNFRQFIQTTRRFSPVLPIVYISIKPSPSRLNLLHEQNYTNHLIREDIQTMENVYYIDIFNSMLTANHLPRSELFLEDNLHLNEQGYAIWTRAIQDYLHTHGFVSKSLINCELSFIVFALNLLVFVVFFL
jgi:lysophospholipase L1-like esterase